MKNGISSDGAVRNKSEAPGSVWLSLTSGIYLDKVGQLRGHQAVELLLAQGAGGSIFPSKRLELGDEGADGSFHGGEA